MESQGCLVSLPLGKCSPRLKSRPDAMYFRSRSHVFGSSFGYVEFTGLFKFHYYLGNTVPLGLGPIKIPGLIFLGPFSGIQESQGFLVSLPLGKHSPKLRHYRDAIYF